MKIVYCIHSLFNSGGMERIITEKANALSEMGHQVIVVTADQQDRPLFFPLSEAVKHYDLGINYSENKSILSKSLTYFFKKKKHKSSLSKLLYQIQPDITISTMGNEFLFLYKIKDKSKKVLEIHFSKGYRLMYNRSLLWHLIDSYRSKQEEIKASYYDRFIVLTNEDKTHWKNLHNIEVIPNFITLPLVKPRQEQTKKNILIAVGRLAYQKGFDRLIAACALIKNELQDWEIHIYGNGELKSALQKQIESNDLANIIRIYPATNTIEKVYQNAKGFLCTSRFEGLPLVLIEAMSYGIPVISFTCSCGPRDIITDYQDGILVENGDIKSFSEAIKQFVEKEELRNKFSYAAKEKAKQFSKEHIMLKWNDLFTELLE